MKGWWLRGAGAGRQHAPAAHGWTVLKAAAQPHN